MSRQSNNHQPVETPPGLRAWFWPLWVAVGVLVIGIGIVAVSRAGKTYPNAGKAAVPQARTVPTPVQTQALAAATNALPVMEINHAVMVTVELDLGSPTATIADALREVERRYQPDDGSGRTFSILDAYGEPTPQGKLHISMHLSTEKPGVGSLIFRRTGEVLWQSRIVAGTNAAAFTGKNLLILVGDESGHTITVDGSNNPKSILDAKIKHQEAPVSAFWPEDAEREVTFIYSACGCPVKVLAKRAGEHTVRTKELPVIFPDDPAVATLINRLMGW